MKSFKLVTLLFIAAAVSSCGLFKGAKVTEPIILKYDTPVGQEFIITTKGDSEINQESMGQEVSVTTQSGSTMVFKSLSQNENSGTNLEIKYTEMSQFAQSPMGGGETDFSSLLGKTFSMDLGAKGKCSNFTGFDDFEPISNALGEQVDAEIFRQGLEQMFFALPDGPVEVGTTWNEDITEETPYGGGILKTEGTVTYTVTEITNIEETPCVIIQSVSEVSTTGTFQQQGMDIELNRKNKGTGKTAFAYKKGMFISSEMSSSANGSVEVPSMNMSIPQEIKTTGNWKVVFK